MMTREEAQIYVRAMLTGHHKDATSNHYVDVAVAVDRLFDEFEAEIKRLKEIEWMYEELCK